MTIEAARPDADYYVISNKSVKVTRNNSNWADIPDVSDR